MASVGFAGALGNEYMDQAIRQRMIDALNATKEQHAMSVEDQRLQIEKDRYAQEAADRAVLRSQQGQTFNESLAEKTAANLTPQSIVSPELAKRFTNTSLAPLISPDKTLPSTSMATAAPMVGAPTPDVAPTVTQNAPTLTGQLRYAGTPTQVETASDKAAVDQMASDPATPHVLRGFLRMRAVLPKGENIPYQLITEPNGPPRAPEPAKEVIGPNGKPINVKESASYGMTPYHVPPQVQTVTVQTVDPSGQPVERVMTKADALKQGTFAAKPTAQMQTHEMAKSEAQDTLNQLDQAVENAKDFIGPGEGRVSTFEQMVGNSDPRVQELGAKMLAAKVKVGAALTPSVRSSMTPAMLAQWDNLLANKVSPEGLKGTIKAFREIIGGAPTGGTKPTAADLIKKYGGGQ